MVPVVLFGLLVLLLAWAYSQKRRNTFPPGPIGFPILGHLPLLGKRGHKVLMKWKDVYGPIIGIRFGSYRTVVIQDPQLIRDALSTSAFSGRPMLNSFTAISNGVLKGIVVNEGKTWAEQRRFAHKNLKDFRLGTKSMESQILNEVLELLERLHVTVGGNPILARECFSSAVVNVMWASMFSERLDFKDPEVAQASRILEGFIEDTDPLAALSIFIPWIARYMPKFSGYDKLIKDLPTIRTFLQDRITAHSAHRIPGQPRDFVDSYMDKTMATSDETSSFHPKHDEMLFVLYDLFAGGVVTVNNGLTNICAHLIHLPRVQEKLQDEIDGVIGKDRLPCLADRAQMHYTEAVIHEALRYSTIFPLSIFHNVSEETRFEGYVLPKDTMVIANIYACHFDVKLWGDPENFRPERFLDVGAHFCKNDNMIAFGVGKRVCFGEALARDELFLFMTSFLQKFTIQCHGDLPSLEPLIGLTASLPEFKMILKER